MTTRYPSFFITKKTLVSTHSNGCQTTTARPKQPRFCRVLFSACTNTVPPTFVDERCRLYVETGNFTDNTRIFLLSMRLKCIWSLFYATISLSTHKKYDLSVAFVYMDRIVGLFIAEIKM